MGSRCGSLRYVPFEETWPPVENNLGGPYWERRLSGKGVHAQDYTPPYKSRYSRSGTRAGLGRGYGGGRGGGGGSIGGKFKLFMACALAFSAIGGCALGIAGCMMPDEGGAGNGNGKGKGKGGRWKKLLGGGAGGSRKPRGRSQWGRRAGGLLGANRSED